MKAEIIVLGSGTSMGVPTLGCGCAVCTSTDPRNRRTRPSIAVTWSSGATHLVVIDTGPDFREQALREGIRHVDAVFYTHAHADHILGLDDLRPLSFAHKPQRLPLYADRETSEILRRIFDYTFSANSTYPNRARVELRSLEGEQKASVDGARFQRVPLLHGDLEVAGFRFGSAAYLTDMSSDSGDEPAPARGAGGDDYRCAAAAAASQPCQDSGVAGLGGAGGAARGLVHAHVARSGPRGDGKKVSGGGAAGV